MKKFFLVAIFLLAAFICPAFSSRVEAGYFKLEPATSSVAVNQTFELSVIVDAGSERVNGADIYITYNAGLVEAQSVSDGDFFPRVSNKDITSGRVYIAAMVLDPASPKTGSGTVARVTFKGLRDASGTISFDCGPSRLVKDDINATNILQCSQNQVNSFTIGSGQITNPTSTPTTPLSTPTIAPTALPRSGSFEEMITWSRIGVLLVFIGGAARLFRLL